ncbi:MAG: DUF1015 domain-containing protein, partial [Acidimicrobiia bacterium]|nr:DUF1015 domain-containing protein [Acidimicrobiia bacterium]
MADVRPFRGLRFDPAVIGDLGSVICPPYDVIDPDLQRALHRRSPYNLVRVEYGLTQPEDTPQRNKYTRSAEAFEKWLKRGVIRPDSLPAMYLHHHCFAYRGEARKRRGLFAAVRLEEWDKGIIRPHEDTAAVFKADRLKVMRATRANVSPVLAMYRDPEGKIAEVMALVEADKPLVRVASVDGESHTLWAITSHARVEAIRCYLAGQNIYIADGHHRYETGLVYRDERRALSPTAGDNAAFDFIMMALIELSDPGVVVLPTHRMVRGLGASAPRGLKERLGTHFDLEVIPMEPASSEFLSRIPGPLTKGQVTLGVVGLEKDSVVVLRLRDSRTIEGLMPADRSGAYRKLDVSVLHHVVLEHLLGVSGGENIFYIRSELEAWQRVARGEFQLAFLLNPVDTYAIKAVADAADKMPHKSTYFYPKA